MTRLQILAVIAVIGVAVGCGKDDPTANSAANNTANGTPNATPNNANNSTTGDNANTTPANMTPGNAMPNNTTPTNNNTTATNNNSTSGTNNNTSTNNQTVMCQGMIGCFAHADCPGPQYCSEMQLPNSIENCCAQGTRGTDATGVACTTKQQCVSGVCLGRGGANAPPDICSEDCGANMLCPDGLECVAVPFTGGSGMWCLPPA